MKRICLKSHKKKYQVTHSTYKTLHNLKMSSPKVSILFLWPFILLLFTIMIIIGMNNENKMTYGRLENGYSLQKIGFLSLCIIFFFTIHNNWKRWFKADWNAKDASALFWHYKVFTLFLRWNTRIYKIYLSWMKYGVL